MIPTTDQYNRWLTVARVVDGDTVAGRLDLGFHVWADMSCRLAGINAPELYRPGGWEARAYLQTLVAVGARLSVSSVKADKYAGRFVGVLWLPSGESASDAMVRAGFAVPWDGTGRRPVPDTPKG